MHEEHPDQNKNNFFTQAKFRVPNYLRRCQPHLSERMRSVLVDWLVEVQESFELNHETLYTAVKMIDIYLSRVSSSCKIGFTFCR